jgi:hypothetical protein
VWAYLDLLKALTQLCVSSNVSTQDICKFVEFL